MARRTGTRDDAPHQGGTRPPGHTQPRQAIAVEKSRRDCGGALAMTVLSGARPSRPRPRARRPRSHSLPVIVITGPTASGKSGLAVELAAALGGTVLNSDALQTYRDLRILSARPD